MKNNKTHILQVVHSLIIGGTERVVCDLVRSFNDNDFMTSVCCLDELGEFGKDLLSEGYNVDVFKRQPGIDINLVSQLKEVYRTRKIDIIHAHQYTPYFYAASASLLDGWKPVIFTEHGRHYPDYVRPKRALYNQLLRLVTAAYTGVSEFTRQSLITFEKMPANRIKVIYNGVWIGAQTSNDERRKAVRTSMGLGESDLLVLSVGRMDRIKDFGTLIQAFVPVAQKIPKAYLWIAGGGDSDYYQKMENLISDLNINERVSLLGSRRDINELLLACDLFVLPSITEAASMTILEAMSAGRAVVATKTGGNPEIIVNGETGILVGVGDFAALSEGMRYLLNDSNLRNSMGQMGHQRVRDLFSMDHILKQYRQLYLEAG